MRFIDYVKQVKSEYDAPIVLARVKNKEYDLNDECNFKLEEIKFITLKEKAGIDAYKRSVTFMMLKAFYATVPIEKITVMFPLANALYVEIKGNFDLNEDLLNKVSSKMHEFVDDDLIFTKKVMHTEDAIDLFEKKKMVAKAELFKFRRVSSTTVYSLDGFYNYFYGHLVYTTKILKHFRLEKYKDGFVLLMPTVENPCEVEELPCVENLYNTLREASSWAENLGIGTISALNNAIVRNNTLPNGTIARNNTPSNGTIVRNNASSNETIVRNNINDIILIQETLISQRINDIAKAIISNKRNIVLIAGPSSSGKTSFSKKLAIQLRTYGVNAHPIACDNFFVDREETPLDANGEYDFESINAIDLKLFDSKMKDLLSGQRVELPVFNFTEGKKEYRGDYLQLGDKDIVIIEGIHCLNEKFLPDLNPYRIYISALTPLKIDEHNRISSSDLRLLRRISRDAQHRNSDAKKTIHMWKKVREGEKANIFPYQENADVIFNSSYLYEIPVIKNIVEPLLFAVDRSCPEYLEAKRLLKFLDFFIAYNASIIPNDSIIREFIGGSCLGVG